MTTEHRQAAAQALVQLRRRIDTHFDATVRARPTQMQCRPGCESCCHVRLTVFHVEGDSIAAALAQLARRDPQLRARVRMQADAPEHAHHCALLVDGVCAIYDDRPLLCRTHGLPTQLEDGSVEVCRLNFTSEDPDVRNVIDPQAINRPLAVMATLWHGSGDRVELAELARRPDEA